jgi:hypothetical protein
MFKLQHFITADINAVKNVMIVKFKGRLVPWEKDDTYTDLFNLYVSVIMCSVK